LGKSKIHPTYWEVCMGLNERFRSAGTFFILDSASTSHVTNNHKLLFNPQRVPEVEIQGVVKGMVSKVTVRGSVQLNKNWKLTDVAYMKNGFANLVSVGRLVAAGFTIILDNNKAIVQDKDGHQALCFTRFNQLWILKMDDYVPPTRPGNTLIKAKAIESDSDDELTNVPVGDAAPAVAGSSSAVPSAVTPKKTAKRTKPATQAKPIPKKQATNQGRRSTHSTPAVAK
jgi:hypothetical protein